MDEKHQIKKRGSKSASVELNYTGSKNEIGKIVYDNAKYFNVEKFKSADECASRLNDFFRDCYENDSFPTVEKMCLALGVSPQAVWAWQNGVRNQDPAVVEMIKKAKEIIAGIDSELVSKGKINPVTYIFRAKNYYGMTDKQEVVLTPNNPLGDNVSEEEIASRLLNATEITEEQ
ncbi:MAG: terminase small subunit [Porcipelethomonas sp.]